MIAADGWLKRLVAPALAAAALGGCQSPPGAGHPGDGSHVEVCGNGKDDDGNGRSDCADPACFQDPGCPACGDGFRDPREVCDSADVNGDTCEARGYDSGVLRCSSTCAIDETSCHHRENCDAPGDEDLNGDADCADVACAALAPCLALTVVSAPAPAYTEGKGQLVMYLADARGNAIPGQPASIDVPAGIFATASMQTSDADGRMAFPLEFGRLPVSGAIAVTVLGVTTRVPLDVVDPPDLFVQTVVDRDRAAGADDSGRAAIAHVGPVTSLAVASDGTLYLGEACRVLAVSPEGMLSRVAGNGVCGPDPKKTAADDAPPLEANLSVSDLALAESDGILFLADRLGGRVRAVDLVQGTMHTVVGGGLKKGLGAEGAPALGVDIRPHAIARGPDGTLYAADAQGERVWRVDLQRSLVSTYRGSAYGNAAACNGPVALASCEIGCAPFFDAAGVGFIEGRLCGLLPGASATDAPGTPGVVRVDAEVQGDPGGGLAHVLGRLGGQAATSAGVATALSFAPLSRPSFDAGGNLALAAENRILLVDGVTSQVAVLGGGSAAGFTGENEPAAGALFFAPTAVAFGPGGDLYVADSGNGSVRRIVRAGHGTPTAAALTPTGGSGQQALLAQKPAQPLALVALDGNGTPLVGETLQVVAGDAGSTAYPALATGPAGKATVAVRLGLVPGPETFDVYLAGLHGLAGIPAHFALRANAPAAGVILTAVNTDGGTTGGPAPGLLMPAPTSQIAVNDVAAASDGSLYLASGCQVFHLQADGGLTLVAGSGSCSSTGDGGAATAASLVATSVALDEKGHTLYVSASSPPLVRAIDLQTGLISAYAGNVGRQGGTGDGGPATFAGLYTPSDLAVGSDGTVYVADLNDSTIRKVDGSGVISTFLHWRWPCTGPDDEGQLAVSPTALAVSGTSLYAAGWVCHGGTLVEGILRADADGSHAFVAALAHVSALAVSPAGALSAGTDARPLLQGSSVYAVDAKTGELTLLAGSASAKTPGDYLRATGAGIPVVHGLAFAPAGHLFVADGSLRLVW